MKHAQKNLVPVMLFVALGCNAVDSTLSPRKTPEKGAFEGGECEPMRPTEGATTSEGCLTFTFVETENNYAAAVGPAANTELLWSGESFDTFAGSEEWRCHQTANGVSFSFWIPENGESATFDVPVPIEKVSDDGYTSYGLPMGTYALPENIEIRSSDPPGKYALRGGLLRAVCFDLTLRTGMGYRIEGGIHRWYDYTGWPYLAPGGGGTSGGGGRGWSWETTSTGYANGAGPGWQQALNNYLGGLGCTKGWEIWIDGSQKCDSFGHMVT